jgi:two-component system cell cycle sensor histidine kinase/response regulator CckA
VIQPAMKSLFMSGYTSEIIAQHGDLEPGLNFLQKPFTIQGFLEKVRKILENR